MCKLAPAHAAEALECLGGNGYVEESGMPRLYRRGRPAAADAFAADAFAATRLAGEGGRAYGTLPAGTDTDAIIPRATPEL